MCSLWKTYYDSCIYSTPAFSYQLLRSEEKPQRPRKTYIRSQLSTIAMTNAEDVLTEINVITQSRIQND